MSDHTWKTLLELHDPAEAEIIKAALEARGLVVELFKESAGTVYGLTVGMLGKIEIAVRSEDFAAAQAWLDAYDAETLETGGDETPAE
jgi:altronate dehydratase